MPERVTNIFSGQVVNILNSIIVTEITIYVSDSIKLVAIITSESYEYLSVATGTRISAVVKPTEILVGKGESGSKFSTRNCLVGVVEELKPCDAMVEVIGSLDGDICISAFATIESIDELNLKVGDNVTFFFWLSPRNVGRWKRIAGQRSWPNFRSLRWLGEGPALASQRLGRGLTATFPRNKDKIRKSVV